MKRNKKNKRKKIKNWLSDRIRDIKYFLKDIYKFFYSKYEPIEDFIDRGKKGYCFNDLWDTQRWLSQLLARFIREHYKRSWRLVLLDENYDVIFDHRKIVSLNKMKKKKRYVGRDGLK